MLDKKKVCDAGHFKCLTREVGNAGDFAYLTVVLWCGRFYVPDRREVCDARDFYA